jgi:hypothetical protein
VRISFFSQASRNKKEKGKRRKKAKEERGQKEEKC